MGDLLREHHRTTWTGGKKIESDEWNTAGKRGRIKRTLCSVTTWQEKRYFWHDAADTRAKLMCRSTFTLPVKPDGRSLFHCALLHARLRLRRIHVAFTTTSTLHTILCRRSNWRVACSSARPVARTWALRNNIRVISASAPKSRELSTSSLFSSLSLSSLLASLAVRIKRTMEIEKI